MALEITSFGAASSLYRGLKTSRAKRDVAEYFGLDDKSFLPGYTRLYTSETFVHIIPDFGIEHSESHLKSQESPKESLLILQELRIISHTTYLV